MDTIFAVFAAIAAAIGAGLIWWRSTVKKQIATMASIETSRAADVATLTPGSPVEVKGTLRVRSPLTAEFSQQPCAYFRSEIEREEVYYQRNSKGESERKTRTTTIYSNMKYGQCLIEDDSGKVGIDFNGAEVEGVQVVNEPTADPSGSAGIIGGLINAVAGHQSSFRRKEWILAADIPVYVLGEVHAGGLVGKPASGSKNSTFVISHKSEEERTSDLTSTVRWLLIGAILLFAVAIGLAAYGIAKKRSEGMKAAAFEFTQRA